MNSKFLFYTPLCQELYDSPVKVNPLFPLVFVNIFFLNFDGKSSLILIQGYLFFVGYPTYQDKREKQH